MNSAVTTEDLVAGVQHRPQIGQTLRFYPQANIDESRVELGVVIKIGQSTVKLAMLGTNGVRDTVRHKDDPRLQKGIDQRQFGCWDYTVEWYERMQFDEYTLKTMEQLDDRVRHMMTVMEIPYDKNPQSRANRVKAENFGRLRRRATDIGIEDVIYLTADQLHDKIVDVENRLVEAQKQIDEARRKQRGDGPEVAVDPDEVRRELLARAQSSPEAKKLALRMSVANEGGSGDNPKPERPTQTQSGRRKLQELPVVSGGGSNSEIP